MVEQEQAKRAAAERAAEWIEDGMRLGLGTGSTVRHLIDVIAERRSGSAWQNLRAVPTSRDTARRASHLGIPLLSLDDQPQLDLYIDGADEVDTNLDLIKGLGGALLREKIVASVSALRVIMVDESKLVGRLGTRAPLPVEIDAFGAGAVIPFLREAGAEPVLRHGADGAPFRTDGGHLIVDCRFPAGIAAPDALDRRLRGRPGVLETGLFVGMADFVVVAGADGVRVLEAAADAARG
jgi:ribose 5-phosphate isomerase A